MQHEPFKVSVSANGQHQIELTPEAVQNLDLVPNGAGAFHLLLNGQSFQAELLEADYHARTYTWRVNGRVFKTHISDHYERLVEQLGLGAVSNQKQNTVKAPMPGLVLRVVAEPGQTVNKGDTLLILEAMKMENVIKAANDGVVEAIHVAQGAAVEKGQLLLEMA